MPLDLAPPPVGRLETPVVTPLMDVRHLRVLHVGGIARLVCACHYWQPLYPASVYAESEGLA